MVIVLSPISIYRLPEYSFAVVVAHAIWWLRSSAMTDFMLAGVSSLPDWSILWRDVPMLEKLGVELEDTRYSIEVGLRKTVSVSLISRVRRSCAWLATAVVNATAKMQKSLEVMVCFF